MYVCMYIYIYIYIYISAEAGRAAFCVLYVLLNNYFYMYVFDF